MLWIAIIDRRPAIYHIPCRAKGSFRKGFVMISRLVVSGQKHACEADTASTAVASRPVFRTDIEGLRALAILLVVGFHVGIPGLLASMSFSFYLVISLRAFWCRR
jgi:hypothetical protein